MAFPALGLVWRSHLILPRPLAFCARKVCPFFFSYVNHVLTFAYLYKQRKSNVDYIFCLYCFFFFNDETIIFFSPLTKFSMQSNAFGCGQFGGFEYSAWELSYGFVHSQVRHIGSVAAVESVAEPVAKHGGGDNFMRATFFFLYFEI
jgi:hypothetical protein